MIDRQNGKKGTQRCKCGWLGHPTKECRCTPREVIRYRGKISGPLLDRIDLHLEVPALEYREFMGGGSGEKTESIRKRVKGARAIQRKRFSGNGMAVNAAMGSPQVRTHCRLDRESDTLLCSAAETLGLSARGTTKILKIARTIADLVGARSISPEHLAEAIQYRSLDRPLS